MAISYPGGLDNFTNPAGTNYQDDTGVKHAAQHANLNDAVEALEAKVGVNNSGVSTSLDYKVKHLLNDADPLDQYQLESQKDEADGYAGLDSSGLLDSDELPDGIAQTKIDGTSGPSATLADDLSALSTSISAKISTSAKDSANGVAGLNASTKLKSAEIPYGDANGVAQLDADSLLKPTQVPFDDGSTHIQDISGGVSSDAGTSDLIARADHTHEFHPSALVERITISEVPYYDIAHGGTENAPYTLDEDTDDSQPEGKTITFDHVYCPAGSLVTVTGVVDFSYVSYASPHATVVVDIWVDNAADGRQILFKLAAAGDTARLTLSRTWCFNDASGDHNISAGYHNFKMKAWMSGTGDLININEHTHMITQVIGV